MDQASIMAKLTKKTRPGKIRLIFCVLLNLFNFHCFALSDPEKVLQMNIKQPWQEWRKDDVLKVSYRASKFDGLIEIKAQAELKSTLAGFINFIEDLNNMPNWLDNAESAAMIKLLSVNENIFVTRFKAFWPAAAREMVIHSHYWQNPDLSLEISVTDASDAISKKANVIRMQVFSADWKIVPTSANTISITYQFIVDPKGDLPQWLIKPITLRGIWHTLNNLSNQLPKSKWQNHNRSDIQEHP